MKESKHISGERIELPGGYYMLINHAIGVISIRNEYTKKSHLFKGMAIWFSPEQYRHFARAMNKGGTTNDQ